MRHVGASALSAAVLAALSVLLLVSFLEYKYLRSVHWGFPAHVQAAEQIIQGTPHWRNYQSRVLGPFMVRGLSWIAGLTFERAYVLLTFALLFASNAVSFAVYWKIFHSPSLGAFWTATQIGAFLWLQDEGWLYLWDSIDMVAMPVFVYAIHTNVSISFFVALFAVGLLNRDSGYYIPAWLIFSALAAAIANGRLWRGRWSVSQSRSLLTGVSMASVGVLIQQLLTRVLFVRESQGDPQNLTRFGDLFWQLPNNLQALWYWQDYRAHIALVTTVSLAIWCLWRRRTPDALSLAMLIGVMLATTFMFARLTETRVWFQFLPFAVLCAAYGRRTVSDRPLVP